MRIFMKSSILQGLPAGKIFVETIPSTTFGVGLPELLRPLAPTALRAD